jgi:hypothetical protein
MMLPMALLVATAPSASDGYFELVGVRPGSCSCCLPRPPTSPTMTSPVC